MRKILIFLLPAIMAFPSYGQESKGKVDINKIGFKFDVNASTFFGDVADTTEIGTKTGFSAGIFYRESFGGIFGGQIELRYVQMGSVNKKLDVENQLDYLRLGAQFKLYPLSSTLGANAFFGLEYGILLSAQQENPDNKDQMIDLTDVEFYKSGDYGVHIGVGLDFDFGLTTDVRLYIGLADIKNPRPGAHNLSTQFHLGWGF